MTLDTVVESAVVGSESRQKQTREQILKATHACLIAVGFEHITTRRIAEAANVNIATLHYYFGAKEALLSAAVAYGIGQSETALREATDNAPDAAGALEAGIWRTWELVRTQPGILRYDLVVRGFRDDAARKSAIEIYDLFRELTQRVLERHVAAGGTLANDLMPEQMATHLNAMIDGVILRYALMRDEDAARLSLSLILKTARMLMGIEDEQPDEPKRL